MLEQPLEIVHLAHTFVPGDVRVQREALAATATGRRVAVVALQGPGELPEEEVGELRVVRLPGSKSRGSLAQYISEYLTFVWRCRRLLATDERFRRVRIVHVHTLPDFLVWSATPARRRGAKIILDLHEIFPEFALAKFPGLPGRLAFSIARLLERQSRRRADVTITVNRPIAELLATRAPARDEHVVLVHNSADPIALGSLRRPDGRRPWDGPLRLIYHGTLTQLYGLDVAVQGVARVVKGGVPVHFTILGDGPERDALRHMVRELGVETSVTFQEPIPPGELRDRLTQADAGLVPTRLDVMTRYSLSNKLLEYVHLGVPLLAARLPSYAAYLTDGSAWFWTPGDPESLAQAIERFAATPADERRARATQAQTDVQNISWDLERQRLIELYQQLLAGG